MSRPLVCVDPGHGGLDVGAVNDTLHLNEKDINLRLALAFTEIILVDDLGFDTLLTRHDDRFVSLADQALYRAKREGRDRVAVFSEPPAESPAAPAPVTRRSE